MRSLILAATLIIMAGCARNAEIVKLDAGADKVKVFRKSDPPASCTEIRPFSATSGSGCGALGSPGNFEGAYNTFRNLVVQMGGNAGLIENEVAPHPAPGCYVNTYLINGVAYKCPDAALGRVSQ